MSDVPEVVDLGESLSCSWCGGDGFAECDDPSMSNQRVVFTETRSWAVDLDTETAEMVLDERADTLDIADTLSAAKRSDPYAYPFDASLIAEKAEDWSYVHWDEVQVIDGTKPASFYWTARKYVMDARHALNLGRYREGDCREMDAVNARLAVIEDELRLLALAVDDGRNNRAPSEGGNAEAIGSSQSSGGES